MGFTSRIHLLFQKSILLLAKRGRLWAPTNAPMPPPVTKLTGFITCLLQTRRYIKSVFPFHGEPARWDLVTLHLSLPPTPHPSLSLSVPKADPHPYGLHLPGSLVLWPLVGNIQREVLAGDLRVKGERGWALLLIPPKPGQSHWQGYVPPSPPPAAGIGPAGVQSTRTQP